MGRSRGGLTAKIHTVVDTNGNPIALKLSEGQTHDGRSAGDLLGSVGANQILLADRGYDSDALRAAMADRGAWANIKPMPHRVKVPAFSPWLYRYRNLVEHFFQQAEALPSRRHTLREARCQLSRAQQTRRLANLDAVYESVT